MRTIPTEEQYPYENLDRLVCVAMRPRGMSVFGAANAFLYERAKGSGPISLDIARSLDPASPREIGIFTGASDPRPLPQRRERRPTGIHRAGRGAAQVGASGTALHRPAA